MTQDTQKHTHDFVQTGTRRSWCRKCNMNAYWDPIRLEFWPEGDRRFCYQPDEDRKYWGYFPGSYTMDWSSK